MQTSDSGLQLNGVSKAFLGVQALADVDFACSVGEIHALVGENGAGKSTLIKVASGTLRADTGSVFVGGEELTHPSPRRARSMGLLTAYQDTSLVFDLTVAENLNLGLHGIRPMGFRSDLRGAAHQLGGYDLPFGPDDTVADLSPASRQLLEVVRALVHKPRVLLLDEPTAALDSESSQRLESLILAAKEHSAIVYISHRLDEVRRMADRLTVIRDGRIQGSWDGGGWSVDEIVQRMVGTPTELAFPPKGEPTDRVALDAHDFSGSGFGPIDIKVRAGEVVGVAGSEGNGQRQLLRALVGLHKGEGEVSVNGSPVHVSSPANARQHGMVFQSGDRAAESVFAELSVMDNGTLPIKSDLGPLGMVIRSREKRAFEPVADDLGIVRASPDQPIKELSGGNQQKVVMAQGILTRPKILIVDEPTQGVDVRARLDIWRVLAEQASQGAAVIVNSSDSGELAGLCNRVYVLSRGRVVQEITGPDITESQIVSSFVDVGGKVAKGDGILGTAGKTLADAGADAVDVGRRVVDRLRAGADGALGSYSVLPLTVLVILMIALGIYTQSKSSGVFLSSNNLLSWLNLAVPLAIVAMAQLVALLSADFDISVGSTMSVTVVVMSYVATGTSAASTLPGIALVLAIGATIGLLNSFIVRALKVNPIIATIATLDILQGVAILIRPSPGGIVSLGLEEALTKSVAGFLPIAFIGVVIVAILADLLRTKANFGLTHRATGLDEESARRTGVAVGRGHVASYLVAAIGAAIAGIFLSAQTGIGDNTAGAGYPLLAFTVCFLAGASLTGGRGSFVGVVLGALFLTMLINITPLVDVNNSASQILTGVFTILAVVAYSLRSTFAKRRGSRKARGGGAPALATGVAK